MAALEECAAVYIKNIKAYKILSATANSYSISIPDDAGFWVYDDYYGWRKMWSILEEEEKIINKKREKYNKIIREEEQIFKI